MILLPVLRSHLEYHLLFSHHIYWDATGLWQFLSLNLLFKTLARWRILVRYFADSLSIWVCLVFFLWLDFRSWVCACVLNHFSHVQLFVTLWTVAHQAPLSMGFSRQEYWSGLPCSPPGDLPDTGIKPCFSCLLHWQVGSLLLVPPGKPHGFVEEAYHKGDLLPSPHHIRDCMIPIWHILVMLTLITLTTVVAAWFAHYKNTTPPFFLYSLDVNH